MFNIFSNRQAPSRDIASHFSRLQSLMHIGQSNSFDGNKRYNTQCETICCKAMFSLGVHAVGAQEILSCDMVQHVLTGVPLQELCHSRSIYQHERYYVILYVFYYYCVCYTGFQVQNSSAPTRSAPWR